MRPNNELASTVGEEGLSLGGALDGVRGNPVREDCVFFFGGRKRESFSFFRKTRRRGIGSVCVTTREKSDSGVNVNLKKKLTLLENCECLG